MLFLSCVCYAFAHVCLLMPCGHQLGKSGPLGSNCVFVIFLCGILGQVWYLIVLIPDLCPLSYFTMPKSAITVSQMNIPKLTCKRQWVGHSSRTKGSSNKYISL